jgi:hypothetical protein
VYNGGSTALFRLGAAVSTTGTLGGGSLTGPVLIGFSGNGSSPDYFSGKVGEIILVPAALTTTDRQSIEGVQGVHFGLAGFSGSTTWTDTANWSITSGGAGGAAAPGATNTVYFDGNGLGNAQLGSAQSVASIVMASGYTGTLGFGTSTLTVGGTADLRSGGSFTGSTGGVVMGATATLTPPASGTIPTLTISGGTTTLSTNALAVAGTLTISGGATLTTGGRNISVAGNWANSGTFTHGSATVTLNGAGGTTQVLSGTTTFNNLTATCTTARTVNFTAGSTQTVGGTLTLTGASGQLLSLRSTTPGTYWKLDPQSTRSCSYVDVRDGWNPTMPIINPSTSTDSGHNLGWFAPTLGLCWAAGTSGKSEGDLTTAAWALGTVASGAVRRTDAAGSDAATDFIVRNTSTVPVTLTATTAASTANGWTLAAVAGADRYFLGANGDGSATYSALYPSGATVATGLAEQATNTVDLKFIAPIVTTRAGETQTMTVTITATGE